MSDLYEEYGLEMEAEPAIADPSSEHGKDPVIKKKGGLLRSILCVLLGIVIGVGGIAGGGYFALTQPARSAIETIGGFAGINYEEQVQNKFLSEEYEDKTLLDIMKELATVVKDKNLSGVVNIVPSIGDYIDTLVGNMSTEFGVEMNSETIINTPFDQLPAYLGETFRTTPLGNMLKATSKTESLEPILMEICYGEEGVHYHLDENGEVVMNEGYSPATFETLGTNPNAMINNVSLEAVLPPSADDTLMLSMAYGREGVSYELATNEDGTVKLDEKGHPIVTMLPLYFEKDGDNFYDYHGEAVNCTVETLENGFIKMEKAPVYDGAGTEIYFLKEDASGKYYAYSAPTEEAEQVNFKKTMIGDLSENSSAMINNIYLKDALNVHYDPLHPENDPHKIMFSLAYGTEGVDYRVDPTTLAITMIGNAQPRTIGDLRSKGTDIINDIAISDIMSAEATDALGMYLLYGRKDIHYSLDESNNITMLQQFIAISSDGTTVYNEYGEKLQWKTELLDGYVLDTENLTFTNIYGTVYTYQVSSTETIETPEGDLAKCYLFLDGEPALFTKHSLGELSGGDNLITRLTDRLSMAEVLGEEAVSDNKFLKHVSDCPINDVPNAILDLSVTDMFSDEVYGVGSIKHEGETPLTDANGNIIKQGEYYFIIDGALHKAMLKSTWKYLLTDPEGIKKPSDYKMSSDMDALLTNMTTNVDNATLNDLYYDGFLKLDSTETLTTDLLPAAQLLYGKTKLGELTVTEMLDYTAKLPSLLAGA